MNIGKREYVAAFKIETWAIQIRAVCKIPASWMITAGKEENPGGHILGRATGFMANLDYTRMDELKGLFLIDDPDFDRRPSRSEPAMFKGSDHYRKLRHILMGQRPGNPFKGGKYRAEGRYAVRSSVKLRR